MRATTGATVLAIWAMTASGARAQTQNVIFPSFGYPKVQNGTIYGDGTYDVNTNGGYTFVKIVLNAKNTQTGVITTAPRIALG